jgi:hypothetical protein
MSNLSNLALNICEIIFAKLEKDQAIDSLLDRINSAVEIQVSSQSQLAKHSKLAIFPSNQTIRCGDADTLVIICLSQKIGEIKKCNFEKGLEHLVLTHHKCSLYRRYLLLTDHWNMTTYQNYKDNLQIVRSITELEIHLIADGVPNRIRG